MAVAQERGNVGAGNCPLFDFKLPEPPRTTSTVRSRRVIQNTGDETAQAGETTPRGAGEAPQLPATEAEPRMAKRAEPGEPPRKRHSF